MTLRQNTWGGKSDLGSNPPSRQKHGLVSVVAPLVHFRGG